MQSIEIVLKNDLSVEAKPHIRRKSINTSDASLRRFHLSWLLFGREQHLLRHTTPHVFMLLT